MKPKPHNSREWGIHTGAPKKGWFERIKAWFSGRSVAKSEAVSSRHSVAKAREEARAKVGILARMIKIVFLRSGAQKAVGNLSTKNLRTTNDKIKIFKDLVKAYKKNPNEVSDLLMKERPSTGLVTNINKLQQMGVSSGFRLTHEAAFRGKEPISELVDLLQNVKDAWLGVSDLNKMEHPVVNDREAGQFINLSSG